MTRQAKRIVRIALAVFGLVVLAAIVKTGLVDRWARAAIVNQLEQMTGGRVELDAFQFHLLSLRAELGGLTIHGLEPEGTPPLFHVDGLRLSLRPASLLGRIALGEVGLEHPMVHVRIDPDGRSNVPSPKIRRAASAPWHQRLFAMSIEHLRLDDGSVLVNDVGVPLAAEGGQLRLVMDYDAPAPGKEFYHGELSWQRMETAARRYRPFRSDIAAKFTLTPGRFTVDQFHWKLSHSEVEGRFELSSFARPEWAFHYRVRLDLADVRTILRKPHVPGGEVESTGEGRYAAGRFTLEGRYAAHRIAMPYEWFHNQGMETRGSLVVADHHLEIPDFQGWALGGTIAGRVDLDFHGLAFRADTHARGMSLAALLAAVDHRTFPVRTLHWNGTVAVDSVTTWTADFKHVVSRGQSAWSAPAELGPGEIPTTARLDFHYEHDRSRVEIRASEITTPSSHLEIDGVLDARDSSFQVKLDTSDLLVWDDFINYLRGPEAEPRRIAGRASWQGRLEGPLRGPTFTGHVRTLQAKYDRLDWDEIEGDMTYSPEEFRLANAQVRRGRSTAVLGLWLELDQWSFLPESRWSLTVQVAGADTDELQSLFGTAFSVHGVLAGEFRGGGTRDDPRLQGTVDLAAIDAWGFHLERARGQISLSHRALRVTGAELQIDSGRITGNFTYLLPSQEVAFDLAGEGVPLERIERIQTATLPLGGRFQFTIRGHGPLRAPTSAGALRLSDLRVGDEVLGSFEGRLASDGRHVHLDLNSAIHTGKLVGGLDLTLGDGYPLDGEITVEQIDLDPFIKAGLHLKALTGHSRVDGRFHISGELAKPEAITVQADISRVAFDYEYVKLENAGPLRLVYRRNEVRVQQANLRGSDTNLVLTGSARFDGERPLNLNLSGAVNLRLAGGFVPGLDARGAAQVDVVVAGTLSNPRVTGQARVESASATYDDFPAGLSQVTGDFVFDRSRLLFDNVTAEAGGGRLLLSGAVTYGPEAGGLRYDITAKAQHVRIRYPEGMSWLTGGELRLSGTPSGGVLSGRVAVQRLLMTRGFNVTSILIASKEAVHAPATTSSFLNSLRFDIEAVSSPDARLEWSSAHLEIEGSLRVRGTWEHPSFLGHIHLLAGEITFRGNRYRLTRGDIDFSNPFRLDPELNIEATTTIHQYEVTLDFTGPASALKLSYRSEPPLPESDVIALLALGHTGQESQLRTATASTSQESGASALLSEAISSQVGGRIERLFGISRFQVDPFLAGTGAEPNAAARVTIEQQVARDLTITYSSNATSNQQQVIQVEYAVSRDISIVALRDINGSFDLDVKFKKHFK